MDLLDACCFPCVTPDVSSLGYIAPSAGEVLGLMLLASAQRSERVAIDGEHPRRPGRVGRYEPHEFQSARAEEVYMSWCAWLTQSFCARFGFLQASLMQMAHSERPRFNKSTREGSFKLCARANGRPTSMHVAHKTTHKTIQDILVCTCVCVCETTEITTRQFSGNG